MKKLARLALAPVLVLAVALLFGHDGQTVEATHGNLEVHVHDDYYHPVGAFLVSGVTDHSLAKAGCEKANPDAECDAVIHVGDTITWVAPPPTAVNEHTVTECTDNTFSVCGPAVDAVNPIGDSGLRDPPPAVAPDGWPYGPIQFNDPGTFYYRCDVHPDVMRGRVVVLAPVGGVVELPTASGHVHSTSGGSGGFNDVYVSLAIAIGGSALVLLATAWYARRRWLA